MDDSLIANKNVDGPPSHGRGPPSHQLSDGAENRGQSVNSSHTSTQNEKPKSFASFMSRMLIKVKRVFEEPLAMAKAGKEVNAYKAPVSAGEDMLPSDIDPELLAAFTDTNGAVDMETALAMQFVQEGHSGADMKAAEYYKHRTMENVGNLSVVSEEGFSDDEFSWHDDDSLATDDSDGFPEYKNKDKLIVSLQASCPGEWTVHLDDSSSEPFFYNPTSGHCVWSLDEVNELEKGSSADLLVNKKSVAFDAIDQSLMKKDCALLVMAMQRDFFFKNDQQQRTSCP
jgi:hypothetical protein